MIGSTTTTLRATTRTLALQPVRPFSQLSPRLAAAATSTHTASSPAASTSPVLDWNTFFQLRKSRRRWQLLFSIVGSLAGGTGGAMAVASGATADLLAHVPLDPMISMGLVTTSTMGLGWLAGPSAGSGIFHLLNKKIAPQFTAKENDFFARIKRNRVDPSSSSAGNPVPDYYGEKIGSVTGYRHWLKDQRAFNNKRTSFV